MTRTERCGLSTLLSIALAAGAALAQQGPFPFGGMMGGPGGGGDLQLLANASVQKDLDLTVKQKTQLRSVEEAAKANFGEMFAAVRENGIDPMAIGEQMTAIRQEQDAKVGRVLDKKQKTRLGQIKLQREGLTAASRSEVASKLKITSPQSKQIKKILESMNKEIAAALPTPPQGFGGPPGGFPGGMDGPPGGFGPPGGLDGVGNGDIGNGDNGNGGTNNGGNSPKKKGGNRPLTSKKGDNGNNPEGPGGPGGPGGAGFEELRAKMEQGLQTVRKARESATKQVEALLTDDQKTAWAKLTGEPFDLSTIQQGPGGPGGPREKGQVKKKAQKDEGENQ